MRFFILFAILAADIQTVSAQQFDIVTTAGKVSIVYASDGKKLDSITAHLLANDIEAVTDVRPEVTNNIEKVKGNAIIIGTINSRLIQSLKDSYFEQLDGKWECYSRKLVKQPFKNIPMALVVAGSDPRGTAYGVFSLSEKIGVSPWYWWADVHPQKKKQLSLDISPFTSSSPSVKFRGIFINDEDWGLQPWAAKTFEPETGDIGPKTYAKVFELLLRLKANLIWPAMHPSTKAFFHYPGNVKTAEDYQIVIGSSHAEPMLRNNVGEWNEKTMGHFNYITNKEKVYQYWEDRIKESKDINAIYTIGMRGVHDSGIEGVKDPKEAVPLLERIFNDQRELFKKYINKDVTAVPQAFTIYKEVLDIYDSGLKVPDDVTIVWPDDNYGYIQRLNTEKEKARKGGSGVYYHASYWGRPHDYLWLSSAHPSLVREEMMKAYENGANKLWVLNVGDIKPLEYNIEEFLDMAYDAEPFKDSRYPRQHLLQWASYVFGKDKAQKIQSVLWEYYQLAFERKPEFMGWSQTEPTTKTTYTDFNHFFYGDEAQQRIDRYQQLEQQVKTLHQQIASKDESAFYELVYYPVMSASLMNKKFLYRDKSYFYSKQNRLSAPDYAQMSQAAYDSIVKETDYFNNQLEAGKWKGIMSMKPRDLPVYQAPVLPEINIDKSAGWSLAPEGFVTKDSSLLNSPNALMLPAFDPINRQEYFVDIFLNDTKAVEWTASVSDPRIHLSKINGHLSPEAGQKQIRIWVTVDWNKSPAKGSLNGQITFTGGGKQLSVTVTGKPALLQGDDYKGFVENNGYVSIHAAHYTRLVNKGSGDWKLLPDIGYTLETLETQAVALKDTLHLKDTAWLRKNASLAEYDFYTYSSSTPSVTVFTLPTHPLNNSYGMRYAVSVDNGEIKIVDFRTFGRSEEWKQNVLSNRAQKRIQLSPLNEGSHKLQIYSVDPGVVLQDILIDLGGLKKAYSAIPETKKSR